MIEDIKITRSYTFEELAILLKVKTINQVKVCRSLVNDDYIDFEVEL